MAPPGSCHERGGGPGQGGETVRRDAVARERVRTWVQPGQAARQALQEPAQQRRLGRDLDHQTPRRERAFQRGGPGRSETWMRHGRVRHLWRALAMTPSRSWGIVSSGPISESWKDVEPS
ncbi:MAG TPA: hypothetical protein VIJ02_09725, partial [Thermoanaerobaculia bacterium]